MNIAISSLAFIGKSAEEIISIAQQNNFAIEFSSGMPFRADIEEVFLSAPVKKYAHNYFPAPEIPFVLNLASADDSIRNTSIQHCIRGMELSKKAAAPFFSAHAGFCVDPKPEELGKELSRANKIDREYHWELFKESLRIILEKTKHLEIDFLVENNVLAKMNVYEDGTNPLLCVDAPEMLRLISEMNDTRLGILLDTAHLKVSALTLNFDLDEAVLAVAPHIKCIHHSDNEGIYDNNMPLDENYWFLKHMLRFKDILHVVEVRKPESEKLLSNINLLSNS